MAPFDEESSVTDSTAGRCEGACEQVVRDVLDVLDVLI